MGSDMTKEEFRQLCKVAYEKQHGFVVIDLSSKNTTVNMEVGLTSFTYQTKLKIKTNIMFSLQNGESFKQFVNNTEAKRSFSIVVSDNKTRFKTWFEPHIQFYKNKDYEIALINLETYYSLPNIDNFNNCFTYTPGTNALWYNIIIPEDSYDVENINDIIQREMRKKC